MARRGGGAVRRGRAALRRRHSNAARCDRARPLFLFLSRRNLVFFLLFSSRHSQASRPVPRLLPRRRERRGARPDRPARRARARPVRAVSREARGRRAGLPAPPDAAHVRREAGGGRAPRAFRRPPRGRGLRGLRALGADLPRDRRARRPRGLGDRARAPRLRRPSRGPRPRAQRRARAAGARPSRPRSPAGARSRVHHRLPADEAARLLADLAACRDPWTCPHGRPTSFRSRRRDREALREARLSDGRDLFGPKLGLTLPLCGLHFVFFFLSSADAARVVSLFGFFPATALEQPWTFVTYQFLHSVRSACSSGR